MVQEIDTKTGDKWIRLSKEEIKLGFLAECIEGVAEAIGCNYLDAFKRMENANMTENYILRHYEVLHTESWENIITELVDLLHKRETSKIA